jgi:DNA-binding GntR family transcriptional regulator
VNDIMRSRGESQSSSDEGTQAQTASLVEIAYRYLRERILSGEFEVGAPLRQEDIAKRLGISRLPVREALSQLDAEGLAVLRPRRGYVVTSLSEDDIDDIFDVQGLLEAHAVYLATLKRTAKDTARLDALLNHLDKLASSEPFDVVSYGRAVTEFHSHLMDAAQRPYLSRLIQNSRNILERYVRLASDDRGESHDEHHAIMAAYRAGDAAACAQLCRSHVENTRLRLKKILAERRASSESKPSPRSHKIREF